MPVNFILSITAITLLVHQTHAYCETSITAHSKVICTVPRSNLSAETCSNLQFSPGSLVPNNTVASINGLTENPKNKNIFAILSFTNKQAKRELVQVDNANTGNVTHIANVGGLFSSISFACDGKLYGITGKRNDPFGLFPAAMYEVNPTTGGTTFVKNFTNGNFGNALAYDFDDGYLYRAGSLPGNKFGLQKILSNWSTVDYVVTGVPNVGAMAYEGGGQFWLLDSNKTHPKLYSVSDKGGMAMVLQQFVGGQSSGRKGFVCLNHSVAACPTTPTTTTAPMTTAMTTTGVSMSTTTDGKGGVVGLFWSGAVAVSLLCVGWLL